MGDRCEYRLRRRRYFADHWGYNTAYSHQSDYLFYQLNLLDTPHKYTLPPPPSFPLGAAPIRHPATHLPVSHMH